MSDDAADASATPAPPRLGARLAGARLALAWERAWPAVWPAFGVAGGFVAVSLFDVLPALPGWVHGLILLAFAAAFVWLAWGGVRSFSAPARSEARRRLEQASGLDHRPLQVLSDRLAAGADDPGSTALWRAHQRRMAEAVRRLRVGFPAPGLARYDPKSLRAALLLVLVVAAAAAWSDPGARLARAVKPDIALLAPTPPAVLELWITPPAYTGLAPLFPKPASPAGNEAAGAPPLRVPAGSMLTAQVSGGAGVPELVRGERRTAFEAVDDANARIETAVDSGGPLVVEQRRRVLGAWTVELVADAPPTIAFAAPPGATERGTLRMAYTAEDDYGIEHVAAEIRRTYEGGELVGKEMVEIELPLPALGAKSAEETSYQDLTPHRWAGLPVVIRLRAKDGAGQSTFSDQAKLMLPEREFRHPVARAIIEQRKRLTTEPERRRSIIRGIQNIGRYPSAFDDDTVTYLALASAMLRLVHEKAETAIAPVRDLLWDTALRVEDGRLSIAERDLRRVQQELMRALAENAPDAEVERLMREFQEALNRFVRELAQQLANQPRDQQAAPFDPRMQLMQSTDLQRMMRQIRDLIRSGARQAARDLLAQLQSMLENLRAGRMFSGDPRNAAGNRALSQLQDLIRRQGDLMNRTFRQSRARLTPPQWGEFREGAAEQRALREALRRLREALRGMGLPDDQGPGRALDQAGGFMGEAAGALGRDAPGQAVGPQGQALDALQRAGRGVMEQMMSRFARQSGMALGRFNPLRQRRDPLGRYLPGNQGMDTRDIGIPDEGTIERAQRILRELRRRAGQSDRPAMELDYINRLLQRF